MKQACLGELFLLVFAFTLAGQTPAITAVVNSAGGAATIESGSWVSIYGTNLAATTRAWQASDFSGVNLPTTIDNVTVTIDGKKAAVAYVSPGQLNVQAPADSVTGTVPVQVTNALGTAAGTATLQSYSPAFFTYQSKYVAARHNSDGTAVAPAGYLGSSVSSRPAQPNESIQIYATGLGPTTPAVAAGQLVTTPEPISNLGQLHVTVGGVTATVQYAGVVAPGEYQINLVVPPLADGDQAIVATIDGSNSQSGVYLPIQNSVTGTISVTITPGSATVRAGATVTFAAKVANTSNQTVSWQVNAIAGGNAAVGTISASGVYSAPAVLPQSNTVLVTAISQQSSAAQANVTVTLQNALPVVTAVSPATLNPGNATITVTGTGFAPNAVIYLAGSALPTTFVSPTQVTATANVLMPAGRLAAVKVTNPNPGSATSTPIAVPVRVANELMPYAQAVRFLEMTTWGAAPQDVVNLQTMGQQAWLAAQFAQSASTWPDPDSTTENVSRLQTAFWNVALNGSDQLRQRASFALAQIMVASAVNDTTFQQMVSYQRVLGNYAFDTYRHALNAVTLNPAMGDYLNMVNNDKANRDHIGERKLCARIDATLQPGAGATGCHRRPADAERRHFAGIRRGDGAAVRQGAHRLDLWGNAGIRLPLDQHAVLFRAHDRLRKLSRHHPEDASICRYLASIAAGGTAESDISAAYDCVFQQSNVAPFISYRLIQRFVQSSPSPAYVGRVAPFSSLRRATCRP